MRYCVIRAWIAVRCKCKCMYAVLCRDALESVIICMEKLAKEDAHSCIYHSVLSRKRRHHGHVWKIWCRLPCLLSQSLFWRRHGPRPFPPAGGARIRKSKTKQKNKKKFGKRLLSVLRADQQESALFPLRFYKKFKVSSINTSAEDGRTLEWT